MFDSNSRYYNIENAKYINDDREIVYKRRRFLTQGQKMTVLQEVTVFDDDRLDLITHKTLGDPLEYWQVCDANNAMNPLDLTAEIGRKIRIPMPEA